MKGGDCRPFCKGFSGMNAMTYDVVIVGAGIVGTACADECARGGMRVALLESEIVGGGATAAGMGHIVVMDDSDAQFALTRYSQQLWQSLRPHLPADVEYEQCGTIWVAADEEEMAEVRRKQSGYSRRGVPVEILDQNALRQLEPNLRKGLAGGLLVPEDGVLYPPCAARFLSERAQAQGAKVHVGCKVSQIGNGTVRLADGNRISAAVIVNATGSWALSLTLGLKMKKRKGHLAITDRYPGFVKHQLVELGYLKSAHSTTADSVAFNVQPRKTGQILIGSSRQYDAEHKEVDHVMPQRSNSVPGNRSRGIRNYDFFGDSSDFGGSNRGAPAPNSGRALFALPSRHGACLCLRNSWSQSMELRSRSPQERRLQLRLRWRALHAASRYWGNAVALYVGWAFALNAAPPSMGSCIAGAAKFCAIPAWK
jgi:D-hydroxyproline dehydrogenase subunit beta